MSILRKLKVGTEKSSKGFTLVELLVVIAIIGVLATLILLQLGAARQKARDAKRVADINQVRSGLELFFDDNGRYENNANLFNALVNGRYLTLLPRDPLTTGCTDNYNGAGCYGYAWNPNASPIRFHIWAELERRSTANNADLDFNSSGATYNGSPVNAAVSTEVCTDSNVANATCTYDVGQTN